MYISAVKFISATEEGWEDTKRILCVALVSSIYFNLILNWKFILFMMSVENGGTIYINFLTTRKIGWASLFDVIEDF